MNDSSDNMLKALNRQIKEIETIYCKIALQLQISQSAFWILYIVSEMPCGCSQQDICRELSFSKTTVNSAVQAIGHRGFANLERAPNTARRKRIRLTEYGTDFVAKYITPLREAERKAFGDLRSDERKILVEASEKYAKNLNAEIKRILLANEK